MSFDSVIIQHRGFHPSDFSKAFVESLMGEICNESPVGSKLKAVFSKQDDHIKGVVQVTSPAGPFFALATGYNVKDVSKKIFDQMRRKIGRWKTKRFSHQGLTEKFSESDLDYETIQEA